TRPPVVTITSPAPGSLTGAHLIVRGLAADTGSGVAGVRARLDSGEFTDVIVGPGGTFNLTIAFPSGGLAEGEHTVQFLPTARAGTVSAVAGITPPLDTLAPTAVGPAGTLAAASSLNVTYSEPMAEAAFEAANYTLTAEGGPPVAVASVLSSADGRTALI